MSNSDRAEVVRYLLRQEKFGIIVGLSRHPKPIQTGYFARFTTSRESAGAYSPLTREAR